MASEEEEPKRGFKVQDRRRFTASGETLDTEADARSESPPPPPPTEEPPPRPSREAEAAAGAETAINFSTFVLSLSTQALAHLGEIPDPVDNTTRVDLAAARQFIDILAMLQEKTVGNLDRSEAEILEHALYDLRMRFVGQSQKR
jgi:hypothetical protein